MPPSPARPLAQNVLNTPGTAYMGDVLRAAFRDARTVYIDGELVVKNSGKMVASSPSALSVEVPATQVPSGTA